MDLALGLIETRGLVGAIEAADAMVKAADVKIISKEKVTGALIIIKVMGETAAVKSSVDAGSAAAQRVGELISSHVIPRPDNQIDVLLFDEGLTIEKESAAEKVKPVPKKTKVLEEKKKQKAEENISASKTTEIKREPVKTETISEEKVDKKRSSKIPPMEQLVVLNVHALRRIARSFDDFPIKGREISKANRAKLLDHFKNMQ